MRKVLFKSPGSQSFDKTGFFHLLGNELVKVNGGYHSVTVAFVETSDGIIVKVDPQDLKFVEAPEE